MRAIILGALCAMCACSGAVPAARPCTAAPVPIASVQTASLGPPAQVADDVITVGDFDFGVHARAFANLAYQLDCLGTEGNLSCDTVHELWKPGWTAEDDSALAAWKRVRKKYTSSATLGGDPPAAPVPLPGGGVDIDKMLTIAALLSSNPEDYRSNLRPIVAASDAATLVSSAEHFRPRFDAWWKATGEPIAKHFRDGLMALFKEGPLGSMIARAAHFYAAPFPTGTSIDFDLVVLPSTPKGSHAEQMGNHGLIEVMPDEKPEQRMDVVCHELFHFFYGSRTPEQQAKLAEAFEGSPDPVAGVAYWLLDESVATALGNGVVDRLVNRPDYDKRLHREMGFYGNHAIDGTAKSFLGRTADDPTAGPVLDAPETVAALVGAARDAVGPDPKPIEYLHSYVMASDEGWSDVMKKTGEKANTNNSWDYEPLDKGDSVRMLKDYPALSAVLLVPRARVSMLGAYGDAIPPKVRAAIAAETRRKGAFAYAWRRSKHSMLFLVVADDAKAATPVADALFASDTAVNGVFRPNVATASR